MANPTELEERFAKAVYLIRNGPKKEGASNDERLKVSLSISCLCTLTNFQSIAQTDLLISVHTRGLCPCTSACVRETTRELPPPLSHPYNPPIHTHSPTHPRTRPHTCTVHALTHPPTQAHSHPTHPHTRTHTHRCTACSSRPRRATSRETGPASSRFVCACVRV